MDKTDNKRQIAWRIGTLCIVTYLAGYVTKNILSVSTPEMIQEAFFTKEYTGLLSSFFFIFYAVGQLINGFIGDVVRPKYMIAIGLCLSSVSTVAVPLLDNRILHFAAFALMGFGQSMLRGPIMKTISENTAARHARVICTLFSMAGFGGPLIAGLLSMFLAWRTVFWVVGGISAMMALVSFTVITRLERRGDITFTPPQETGFRGIFQIFKLQDFSFYMFISAIGEIAGSSITFWIPTYSTEHLGLSEAAASTVYSIASLSTLIAPFCTLVLYERFFKDGVRLALVMYTLAAAFFIAVRFTPYVSVNVILLIAAKITAASASSLVWSVYIPGLAKSGKVSGANGVIDAAGYAAASLANAVFASSVGKLGWGGIVGMWCGIMLIGAAVSVGKLLRKRKHIGGVSVS